MIHGKIVQIEQCDQIYDVRKQVIYEETGNLLDVVRDEHDQDGYYGIVLESMTSDNIVGCGRIYLNGSSVVIDKIAVLMNYRKKGYGDFILRMLVNKALNSSVNKIIVYGQKKYISCYYKVGLEIEDHNEIVEDDIPLLRMFLPNNKLKKPCENGFFM